MRNGVQHHLKGHWYIYTKLWHIYTHFIGKRGFLISMILWVTSACILLYSERGGGQANCFKIMQMHSLFWLCRSGESEQHLIVRCGPKMETPDGIASISALHTAANWIFFQITLGMCCNKFLTFSLPVVHLCTNLILWLHFIHHPLWKGNCRSFICSMEGPQVIPNTEK